MKKLLAVILALALCLGGAALAEVEGPLFEAKSISTLSFSEQSDVLKYTNYANGYGFVSLTDGKLTQDMFGALDYEGFGYYEAINENGLDTHGLVDKTGAEIVPFNYSAFQVYSAQLVGAIILVETDEEKGDYSGGFFGSGEQYNIDHVDVWYIPEHKMVGTLTRDQYSRGRGVGNGEYVLVQDRNDGLTLYNAALESVDHLFESYDDPELRLYQPDITVAPTLVSRVTGETLSDDTIDRVSSIAGTDDYVAVKRTVKVNFKDQERCALYTSAGEKLTDYVLGSVERVFGDRYVISEIYDPDLSARLTGVYDLEKGEQIVPFAYDRLIPTDNMTGLNGYFMVVKDDKAGFVDAESNVTCPLDYPTGIIEYRLGCSFICESEEDGKLTLVAGDGTVTDLTELGVTEVFSGEIGSDGQFIRVRNADAKSGVIDWHGNLVVEFVLDSIPHIYQDGYMTYDGAIYHLTL